MVAVHCDKWFGFGDSVLVIAFSLMMMMIMNLDKDSSGNKMIFCFERYFPLQSNWWTVDGVYR